MSPKLEIKKIYIYWEKKNIESKLCDSSCCNGSHGWFDLAIYTAAGGGMSHEGERKKI